MLALPTSLMGWVSYLNRAATTNYLCCGQALEDSLGAGRIGLTHNLCKGSAFFVICKKYCRFFAGRISIKVVCACCKTSLYVNSMNEFGCDILLFTFFMCIFVIASQN